jgi:hypothetical protein
MYAKCTTGGQLITALLDAGTTEEDILAHFPDATGIEFSATAFPTPPPPPITAASLATAFGIVAGTTSLAAAKAKVAAELNRLTGEALSGSDWYVSRLIEVGTAMPPTIATYRGSVRSFNKAKSDAITAAATVEAVIALFQPTANGNAAVFNVPQ